MKIFFILLVLLINFSQKSNANFKLNKLIDLDDPWGASFINDKELIITEKSGSIIIFNINSKNIKQVEHELNVLEYGQGGLLDILYKDSFIYVSYTENRGDWKSSTSIARAKLNTKKIKIQKYLSSRATY